MEQERFSARKTSMSSQRQAQTRKSGPKVKTGCLTCKIRRVKCDEAVPSCLRCLKLGIVCEGYLSPATTSRQKPSRRMILPKDTGISKIVPRLESTSILLLRNGAGFENELGGHCFRTYLEDTAKQISGPFQSSLWRRLIPQISEIEPFVRHAVIAIGALSKQGKSPTRPRVPGSSWQADQYQYALTQYAKSVRGMREAIANGRHDLQKALVACLLVFCFEGMLGNQASASVHAESGLMLLHQWSTTRNPLSKPWLTEKAWKDQRFEGDLLEAFTALDSQVLIFMDHRSAAVHQHSKLSQTRLIQTMPPQFYNLDLARQFWKLIINRNYHFSKQIQTMAVQKAREVKLEDPWEGSAQMDKDELLLSADVTESSSLMDEHRQYQDDIENWRSACTNLFAEIKASSSQREQVGAAILQVQTRMSRIMLAGTFFTTETEYDVFITEFIEIIDLSEMILPWILSSHKGSNPYFYFDVGVVPALFFVASRCRVDAIRKKAMHMLFSANYREGIWDALAVAHIAKWLRDLELEDVAPGEIIPEGKRAVLSAVNIDLFNKRALLAAAQGLKGAGVQRKTLLVW